MPTYNPANFWYQQYPCVPRRNICNPPQWIPPPQVQAPGPNSFPSQPLISAPTFPMTTSASTPSHCDSAGSSQARCSLTKTTPPCPRSWHSCSPGFSSDSSLRSRVSPASHFPWPPNSWSMMGIKSPQLRSTDSHGGGWRRTSRRKVLK